MFVVTVNFKIKPEKVDEFAHVMKQQAYNSLHNEEGCLHFDVCFSLKDKSRVFLYEIYTDAQAFADHLKTEHFLHFDKTVKTWFDSKVAEQWEREEPET